MLDKRKIFALIASEYVKSTYENGYLRGIKKYIKVITLLAKRPIALLKTVRGGYLPIKYFEVVVTSACTLRCKDCANLIQFYDGKTSQSRPCNYDCESIICSIRKIVSSIDEVAVLGILGGEPFLYPNLYKLLYYCLQEKKIKNVRITTNGTISRIDPNVLSLLSNKKFHILFSNYGILSNHMGELIEILDDRHIEYYVKPRDNVWFENSNISNRRRSEKELEEQFKRCGNGCPSLLKGELHYCARSSHGKDLGIVPVKDDEYIDVFSYNDAQKLRADINDFFYGNRQLLTACDYCDMATTNAIIVKPAIQLKNKEK